MSVSFPYVAEELSEGLTAGVQGVGLGGPEKPKPGPSDAPVRSTVRTTRGVSRSTVRGRPATVRVRTRCDRFHVEDPSEDGSTTSPKSM